jgi:CelD/BcsL family acetyltransferase involved in cellulose biosynthesis
LTTTGEAPYIELPSTWEAYLKGLSKKHRYSVVRTLRDFEAWSGGRHEFVHAATASQLEQGTRILIYLHLRRWQSEEGAGTFRSPRFLAFHDRVMPALHRQGALDLSWLMVRGKPIAAMYNIVWNNKVYFYQCGRDPEVSDSIRPGGVLLAHSIRSAIEAGRREFDFLNDVSRYKSQLANASRPMVQLRVARPGMLEFFRRVSDGCAVHTRGIRSRLRKLRT